ncbi:hypothetical protein PTNB85_07636 [Pyrenophora teres f. teres]|nr:hypothetical protein PTNB85_07636 [Pyrenophora teres f. teres]
MATVSADKPRYVTFKILMPNHKSSETEILIHKHLSENTSEDPRSRHVTALLDEFQHEGPNGKHRCLAFEPMGATATSLVDYLTGNNPNIELLDKNNPPEEEYSDENDSEEEYFDQDNPQIIYSAVRYPKWIAQKILGHALRGLAFLHRNGIVHGDLHPGNILFSIDNIHTMGENELLQDEASTKIVVRRVGEERGRSTPMTLFLAQYLHKHIKLDSRLVIKLSDLGASFWVDSPPKQTETPIALRSPEEIFGQNIGTGIDIWVFGCLMFEFLTGNKLFSVIKWGPDPEAQESADDGHIMQLNEIISPLPDAMMELWPRSSECYGPNSEALNPFGDEDAYVCDSIEKKFHNEKLPEIDDEEEAILMSIMQQILVYDPKMRPSAEELLKHPWFADQEVDGPQQAMD